ncbi:MAG: hypothetical protein HY074_09975 [Deltaproteobacteria bacterium]|nr:hypothetical protein [Deltaproteobacteria bacterium]
MHVLYVVLAMLSSTATTAPKAEAAACYAYTACAWGGTISCQTYGDGCTFFTVPYRTVTCRGFDVYGRWVNLFFHC